MAGSLRAFVRTAKVRPQIATMFCEDLGPYFVKFFKYRIGRHLNQDQRSQRSFFAHITPSGSLATSR